MCNMKNNYSMIVGADQQIVTLLLYEQYARSAGSVGCMQRSVKNMQVGEGGKKELEKSIPHVSKQVIE